MKAIIQDSYGPIEALRSRDIESPSVGPTQVLVLVHAAGLHVGDCFTVKGSPWLVRAMTGLRRPKYGVPGLDLAGEVVTVGAAVTRFRPGDQVFGVGTGTCAEYSCADENKLALKPGSLTFEEAAAIPTSGLAALHGVRDAAKLRRGQKILINGASGGVGTFAVQIAKALGAHVTGVCGTKNVALVRTIGADEVIDYTKDDFTRGGPRYDVILDNIENRALGEVRRALTQRGTLVLNSGTGARGLKMLHRLVWPLVLSLFVRHTLRRYLSNPSEADLAVLAAMVEAGQLRPIVENTYPLAETPAALQHIESGRARGKVVIAVAQTDLP